MMKMLNNSTYSHRRAANSHNSHPTASNAPDLISRRLIQLHDLVAHQGSDWHVRGSYLIPQGMAGLDFPETVHQIREYVAAEETGMWEYLGFACLTYFEAVGESGLDWLNIEVEEEEEEDMTNGDGWTFSAEGRRKG